jgi:hypothetical protein
MEGPRSPIAPRNSNRLLRLVNDAGEALVGLCYFGDQESRTKIEADLSSGDPSAIR